MFGAIVTFSLDSAGPIAQTVDQRQALGKGFLMLGGVAVLVLIGGIVLGRIRNRVKHSAQRNQADFTLEEIRRLRDQGDLTISEYETLRQGVIDRMQLQSAGKVKDGR